MMIGALQFVMQESQDTSNKQISSPKRFRLLLQVRRSKKVERMYAASSPRHMEGAR